MRVLARYYQQTMEGYERAGINLPKAQRDRLTKLSDEMTELTSQFRQNIADDVKVFYVKDSELTGMPADFIASRVNKKGLVKLTTAYPDSIPIGQFAESAAVRRQSYLNSRRKGYPSNKDVLPALLEKREAYAKILGFDSYAAYTIADKMAESPAKVDAFLAKLQELAKPLAKQDADILLAEKRRVFPEATTLETWETSYYSTQYKKRVLDFDAKAVREYFPYAAVKNGVFAVSKKLFDVDIKKIPGEVWHPSVELYEMRRRGQLVGHFYLDMHPRDGKYGHAASFPYRVGQAGTQTPVNVLVCNFPQPKDGDPALLDFSDVTTFLHEFGHLIHLLAAGHNKWISSLEWDFVETPSMMLEEWVKDYESVKLFSAHHQTQKPVSREIFQKLIRSEQFGKALFIASQSSFARVSLDAHRLPAKGLDLDVLYYRSVANLPMKSPEGIKFAYGFGHLTHYTATYYTYMWSQVIAKDLFAKFEKNGLFDKKTADAYYAKVLEPTYTKDASQLVEDFLGRPYSMTAFINDLKN